VTLTVGVGLAAAIAVVGWMAYQDRQTAGGEKVCLELEGEGTDRAVVAKSCEQACETGSLASCSRLAGLYEIGDGVKADPEKAQELHASACGVAPNMVGSRTGATSGEATRRWLKSAEEDGCNDKVCYAPSCAALADGYDSGQGGVSSNERVATALYKRVCGVDFDDDVPRGVQGCVGLARQRMRAGQRDAARNYYNASCDGDVQSGCVGLGELLERGDDRGEGRDEKTARSLYQRACDGGNLKGCTLLGRMVEQGKGGWVKNEPEALKLYKRACDGGELLGCTVLAKAHLTGMGGLSKDAVRAAELFRSSCEGGEMVGCAELAAMTAVGAGGLSRDEKAAYALNKKACEGGALLACANLGEMFLRGMAGLTKDAKEGRRLVEQACRGGEPAGCLHLAHLELDSGQMLSHEVEGLLANACDDGEPRACVSLGERLEVGDKGFEQNMERAANLYQRGCDGGAMHGCTQLANLTYQGAGGLEKDVPKSVELNDRACRGGDAVGCARLGLLYALGQGVPKDRARAAELYKGACVGTAGASEAMQSRCETLKKLIEAPAEDAEDDG
jgi:TPR repeat protein